MKTALKVFVAIVALISSFSLFVISASANTSTNQVFTLSDFHVYAGTSPNSTVWTDAKQYTQWRPSTGIIHCDASPIATNVYGYSGILTASPYVKVETGSYFMVSFFFSSDAQLNSATEYYFNGFVETSTGEMIDMVPIIDYDTGSYDVTFAAKIGDGTAFSFNKFHFSTNFPPPAYANTFDVNVDLNLSVILTPEQEQHDELLDAIEKNSQAIQDSIDENTKEITDAIDKQTEELTNGWENDDNSHEQTDKLVGDLGSAESEALGGKSDEQIKAEVDNAMTGSALPEASKDGVIVVGNTFNLLLDSFGSEYNSLLILALSLGLAAYLVGKSYRARGD